MRRSIGEDLSKLVESASSNDGIYDELDMVEYTLPRRALQTTRRVETSLSRDKLVSARLPATCLGRQRVFSARSA
jgi:hypothetical protein